MNIMLASLAGFYAWGQNIGDILQEWEYMGIFEFVLPFLLIFAVVFGILVTTGILGKNKGINMVISLAVGLLAITSYEFRSFVRTLFPYAGMGIAILLVILILVGLFVNFEDKSKIKWIFFGISMFIAAVVILYSLSSYEVFGGGWWWNEYGSAIITGAIVIGLILLVVFVTKGEGTSNKKND